MQVQEISLSREQAVSLNRDLSKVRKKVRLMERFDCEVVFRLGGKENPKISKVRVREDGRPLMRKDRITGDLIEKANDVITYAKDGELFVLSKSGGVSLFDGISPKLKMNKSDRWYIIPKHAIVPEGVVIAKDVQVDRYGQFHYSLQPAYDMPIRDFQEKLESLRKYMRPV